MIYLILTVLFIKIFVPNLNLQMAQMFLYLGELIIIITMQRLYVDLIVNFLIIQWNRNI